METTDDSPTPWWVDEAPSSEEQERNTSPSKSNRVNTNHDVSHSIEEGTGVAGEDNFFEKDLYQHVNLDEQLAIERQIALERKKQHKQRQQKGNSPSPSSTSSSSPNRPKPPSKSSSRNSPRISPTSGDNLPVSNTSPSRHVDKTKKRTSPHTERSGSIETRSTDESRSRDERGSSSSGQSNGSASTHRRYTVKELIDSLGQESLPPSLERRVRDFKFAQSKRQERHGNSKAWGIFGLYAHLSDIRADLEWAEDAAWRRQRNEPYLSWTDFETSRTDQNSNRPWFTYFVVAFCTIMMIVTFAVNGWKFEPLKVNPLIGPSSDTLVSCGARETNLIVNHGEWFRLFSPLVLHAGLVHYVINMLAMWYIGGAVEQSHGFVTAAVLFILPAVGGNILSAICLPQYISVGASGGIFGLIGACFADICLNWNLLFLRTTTDDDTRHRHTMVLLWLFVDIIVNCLIGFTPLVDNFTHLGGFFYGLACGLSTIDRLAVGFFGLSSSASVQSTGSSSKNLQQTKDLLLKLSGLMASVVAIMVTTVLLIQSDGVTSPCHGCRYLSCVPFPPRADDKWWYCDDCDFVTADLYVAANGSGLYEEIELTCPGGHEEVFIVISNEGFTEKEEVRRALPGYCRSHCTNIFLTTAKANAEADARASNVEAEGGDDESDTPTSTSIASTNENSSLETSKAAAATSP